MKAETKLLKSLLEEINTLINSNISDEKKFHIIKNEYFNKVISVYPYLENEWNDDDKDIPYNNWEDDNFSYIDKCKSFIRLIENTISFDELMGRADKVLKEAEEFIKSRY